MPGRDLTLELCGNTVTVVAKVRGIRQHSQLRLAMADDKRGPDQLSVATVEVEVGCGLGK